MTAKSELCSQLDNMEPLSICFVIIVFVDSSTAYGIDHNLMNRCRYDVNYRNIANLLIHIYQLQTLRLKSSKSKAGNIILIIVLSLILVLYNLPSSDSQQKKLGPDD